MLAWFIGGSFVSWPILMSRTYAICWAFNLLLLVLNFFIFGIQVGVTRAPSGEWLSFGLGVVIIGAVTLLIATPKC